MVVELHLGQGSDSVVLGGGGAVAMVFWASSGCVWLISDGILGLSLGFLILAREKCLICSRETRGLFSVK